METEIPNAASVPTVDTSNVIESAPAWTSATPQREAAPAAAVTEDTTEDVTQTEATPAPETQPDITPAAPAVPTYSAEQVTKLANAVEYTPGEITVNFVDELGNFDPQAFGEFMQQREAEVFNKAIEAVEARSQLGKMEADTWSGIKEAYPEIADNSTLTNALKGARIQDLLAGGDGDLNRLASDIVGPIRENRIKAVEEVNKTLTDQKKLETFTPENAAPETQPVSLMGQLQAAVAAGDSAAAQALRHAIRKERINANN